jgi:hypothetical protein
VVAVGEQPLQKKIIQQLAGRRDVASPDLGKEGTVTNRWAIWDEEP